MNRILASLIETSHDKDGIIWPVSLSPASCVVIPVKMDDEKITGEAERVYQELIDAGIDTIIDDREKSAGVKFKDSDLVGFPIQIILGKKSLDAGKIEVKRRDTKESQLIDKDSFLDTVREMLAA
ncbi:His/Gly/Thr/Pro-type tRNA ligase C-terminal domain-containing protein [Candidatus Omnitrophota bacterium]